MRRVLHGLCHVAREVFRKVVLEHAAEHVERVESIVMMPKEVVILGLCKADNGELHHVVHLVLFTVHLERAEFSNLLVILIKGHLIEL